MPSDDSARSAGWMARGACRHEDPELFFPIAASSAGLPQINTAKAVCRGCAVRGACLSYGLENRQDGIWGGTTLEERVAIRQRARLLRPGGAGPRQLPTHLRIPQEPLPAASDLGGVVRPSAQAEVSMVFTSSPAAPAAELRRVLPAPGDPGQDLPGMADRELLAIAASLPPSSGRRAAARDLLISRYRILVLSCARRYSGAPEPAEDLIQVGYVGLVKAINNFDPAYGFGLSSYATTCILGEIKRHFRDNRWQVHVGRPMKELVLAVREAADRLTQQLGHAPAEAELAHDLAVRDIDVRNARLAELVLKPVSLDGPAGLHDSTDNLADRLGGEDLRLERMLGMQAVATHWGELPAREQEILILRFYNDMTQAQIGQQLGISQMHVSRLLAHALGRLRPHLTGIGENTEQLARRS